MARKSSAKAQQRAVGAEAEVEVDRYEVILETAARLFASDGYSRTPLETLAREVGIHKATLYYYFSSKEELLSTCLKRVETEMDMPLRHLRDGCEPVVDRLHYFFQSFVVSQFGPFGRCVVAVGSESLALEPAEAIRCYQRGLANAVADAIRQAILKGELPNCDPDHAARITFGAFHWLPRWYRPTNRRGASIAIIAKFFVQTALQGLAGPQFKALPPAPKLATKKAASLPEDRRTEIVRLATRCFTEKGYDAASIGDIAQAVGLQKASLYHYFQGKAAILSECVRLAHGDVIDLLQAINSDQREYEQRFIGFLRRLMMAQNSEFGVYLYLVRDDQMSEDTLREVKDFRKALRDVMLALVQEGIENGYLRDVDPALASSYIFGITNGMQRWRESETGLAGINDRAVGVEIVLNHMTCGMMGCTPSQN